MFSTITECCKSYHKSNDEPEHIAYIDIALQIIFAVIGILGLSEVLPLEVGITFTVLAVVQFGLLSLIKLCKNNHNDGFSGPLPW